MSTTNSKAGCFCKFRKTIFTLAIMALTFALSEMAQAVV